ncbi:hypothetical protein AB5I41_26355 [Sphingomonas sp. MMS24-JH45]
MRARWGESNLACDVTGLLLSDGRRYMQLMKSGTAAGAHGRDRRRSTPCRRTSSLIDKPAAGRHVAGWALRQQCVDADRIQPAHGRSHDLHPPGGRCARPGRADGLHRRSVRAIA